MPEEEPDGEYYPPALEPSYTFQVGAFSGYRNAEKMVRELDQLGYQAEIVTVDGANREPLFAVRVGEFQDEDAAFEAASRFSHRERRPALVRPKIFAD